MPRDWRLVNSLIRREQLLMPSDGLRSQLAESLESLPRHVVREFPGDSRHWGLLGLLLLPTAFLYATLFGFVSWIWNHPLDLVFRFGGLVPRFVTQIAKWLASAQRGRRMGFLDGLQDQFSSVELQSEWQAVFLAFGLTLLAAEFLAILLLRRIKTCNL